MSIAGLADAWRNALLVVRCAEHAHACCVRLARANAGEPNVRQLVPDPRMAEAPRAASQDRLSRMPSANRDILGVMDHNKITNASLFVVAAHAALVCGLGSVSAAQEPVSVRITAYEEIQPGRATYHYAVTNNSDRPITLVWIGVDAITGDFVLTAAPLGWTRDRGLPRASVGVPPGWTAAVTSAEESTNVAIEWRASSRRTIAPRQTVRGLRVVLPRSTDLYESADWQTTDDLGGVMTGKLERLPSPRSKARVSGRTAPPPPVRFRCETAEKDVVNH